MKKRNGIYVDRTIRKEKIKEAYSSVLPIALIVLLLSVTFTPIGSGLFLSFLFGVLLVVVGIGLFTLGADTAMTPIGEYVSKTVVKSRKLLIILPIYFIVGILITISEPDLQVLASQIGNTLPNKWILILAVGVGVGFFLVIAFLKVVLKMKMAYILLFFYALIFSLSFFVPESFVPLSFDSGGVTTGPMSVPFIIAIGTGVASMRSDSKESSDGFGFTALCSIGPILAVMILGIIYKPTGINVPESTIPVINNSKDLFSAFLSAIPHYSIEVAIALSPIVGFFFITHIFGDKIGKTSMIKIIVGVFYTFIGLVLFLTGVNVGFLPVGSLIGKEIALLEYNWIIVPIGMIIGFFVVAAEPAVHVLTKQVYEVTSGGIPQKALRGSLMIGIAFSVGLAMLRILLNLNIMYFLIPGYLIALVLTFFVPDMFTAIAFDSGGVASGAMTASFLLPLALGVCSALGGDLATQGFGLVAMVAMTPLITIQILGLTYRIKLKRISRKEKESSSRKEQILD